MCGTGGRCYSRPVPPGDGDLAWCSTLDFTILHPYPFLTLPRRFAPFHPTLHSLLTPRQSSRISITILSTVNRTSFDCILSPGSSPIIPSRPYLQHTQCQQRQRLLQQLSEQPRSAVIALIRSSSRLQAMSVVQEGSMCYQDTSTRGTNQPCLHKNPFKTHPRALSL